MNPFFKILKIQNIINEFEASVAKLGWHAANKQFINKLNIKVEAKLAGFPRQGAVLLYANHPTGLDPYLLSRIIKRDDVCFLSDIYQTMKGEKIASHMFPIYYSSWLQFLKRPLTSWPGYIFMRIASGTVSREKAQELNKKSLIKAFEYLYKGHVVLIFPGGGDREKYPWKRGFGRLLFMCWQKHVKVSLYKAYIENLTEPKLFCHIMLGKKYYRTHTVLIKGNRASFNACLNANDYELTQKLKEEYYLNKL